MEPLNKRKEDPFRDDYKEDFSVDWNWLYSRSHLVFAGIVFFGMVLFVWWLTN